MQLGVLGSTDTLYRRVYWDVFVPCAVGRTGMYWYIVQLGYWDALVPCAVGRTGM